MNDNDNDNDNLSLGRRLRRVELLLTRAMAAALHDAGSGRREWVVLSVLAGDIDAPGIAERVQRGKRLGVFAERGWVEADADGVWVLTDEGRAAHERLKGVVAGVREKVSGAVSPEDYATMTASLDTIAAALGSDDADAEGWGFAPGFGGRGFGGFGPGFGRRGRGFGPGFAPWQGRDDEVSADGDDVDGPRGPARGFGPGSGPGRWFGRGFGPGGHCGHPHDHGHPHPHGRAHGRGERASQKAYERGFDAGYARGRESADA